MVSVNYCMHLPTNVAVVEFIVILFLGKWPLRRSNFGRYKLASHIAISLMDQTDHAL